MEKDYIKHFGIKLKNNNLTINKENYAIIDKKVHNKTPQFIIDSYKNELDKRKKIYDDENCTIYSDSWCMKHQKDCLLNYDYNMKYFNSLDAKDFNKSLNKLIKHSKRIKEVYDLNDYKDTVGVYILVLDKYKQIYIGQSTSSIKTRIMSHWNKKKEFDRLIFGKVDNSILSIDSFRALDTTRIYVYPTYDTYEVEEKLVNLMNAKYMLNRTAGGIGSVHNYTDDKSMALLSVAASRKERNFEEYK